jgi:hypothetical protein
LATRFFWLELIIMGRKFQKNINDKPLSGCWLRKTIRIRQKDIAILMRLHIINTLCANHTFVAWHDRVAEMRATRFNAEERFRMLRTRLLHRLILGWAFLVDIKIHRGKLLKSFDISLVRRARKFTSMAFHLWRKLAVQLRSLSSRIQHQKQQAQRKLLHNFHQQLRAVCFQTRRFNRILALLLQERSTNNLAMAVREWVKAAHLEHRLRWKAANMADRAIRICLEGTFESWQTWSHRWHKIKVRSIRKLEAHRNQVKMEVIRRWNSYSRHSCVLRRKAIFQQLRRSRFIVGKVAFDWKFITSDANFRREKSYRMRESSHLSVRRSVIASWLEFLARSARWRAVKPLMYKKQQSNALLRSTKAWIWLAREHSRRKRRCFHILGRIHASCKEGIFNAWHTRTCRKICIKVCYILASELDVSRLFGLIMLKSFLGTRESDTIFLAQSQPGFVKLFVKLTWNYMVIDMVLGHFYVQS